jgi:polyhydroxyalkanoate synthesis regulator phasin
MTDSNDMNKYLFINLVTMLSMSVMQQLGKLVNPAMGKAEINLDAAQATIDTLDMLAAKTKGNLDKDEERMMHETLSMLKMNFVETRDEESKQAQGHKGTSNSAKATPDEKAQSESKKPAEPETQRQDKPEAKPGSEPSNDPKFHKSYT